MPPFAAGGLGRRRPEGSPRLGCAGSGSRSRPSEPRMAGSMLPNQPLPPPMMVSPWRSDGRPLRRGVEGQPAEAREIDLGPGVGMLLADIVAAVLGVEGASGRGHSPPPGETGCPPPAGAPPSPRRGSRRSPPWPRRGSSPPRPCRAAPPAAGRRWGFGAGTPPPPSPCRRSWAGPPSSPGPGRAPAAAGRRGAGCSAPGWPGSGETSSAGAGRRRWRRSPGRRWSRWRRAPACPAAASG